MKIKIIKKGTTAAPTENKPVAADARETARDMVGVVSDWVSEFKARKRAETKAAVKSLLGKRPAPSES